MAREKKMNAFETLQTLFLHDLSELQQIQKRGWFMLPMTRVVKEEHLGRCCYLAEEFLTPADLGVLKQKLGLDERQWQAYKTKISGQ
jgi:hypothetical protein